MEYELNINGSVFVVEVTGFYAGRPAKTWGEPENCYPEEYPEIEFDVISAFVEDADGNEIELTGEQAVKDADECYDDLYDAVMAEHVETIRESKYDY